MRFRLLLAVLAPASLLAHAVSMSTSEIRMDGPTATLELRMPLYEIPHVAHPETALLDHLRLGDGHRTRSSCAEEEGMYVCRADYEFPNLHPDTLQVECTLYQVTVPNHVHLLTAEQGPNTDQLVFDKTFEQGVARFHPPSRAEVLARQVAAGAGRVAASPVMLLLLAAVALAARSGRQALAFAAIFLGAEWISRPAAARVPVPLPAQFFEALLGLGAAYLATEVLLLPEGRMRWIVVALLGLCAGLPLSAIPGLYLTGAEAVQAVVIGALVYGAIRMPRAWLRPVASMVLVGGLAWFGFRVWH